MTPAKSKYHTMIDLEDKDSETVDFKCEPNRSASFETSSEEISSSKTIEYSPVKDRLGHNVSFGKRHKWFSHQNDTPKFHRGQKERNQTYRCESKSKSYEQKKREASAFRYGNYHQYYGYRNQGQVDSRIQCLKREWFEGKDVLDIGCNAGHFTLAVARDLSPRSIIGTDIDSELVKMAMRNVRHYITAENVCDNNFPVSLVLSYGPVAQAMDPKGRCRTSNFPFNVQFIQGNYILPSDELIEEQEEYFDTILCLSLTKWIHLNWGDIGIKRLFRRIHKQLRPKGFLILEAQIYQSYARKKKVTEEIFKHYKEIQLFPEMFNEYLLKEIGFESCELIDIPAHSSQGFIRPIYLFTKGGNPTDRVPKHIIYSNSSDEQCDDSDVEQFSD